MKLVARRLWPLFGFIGVIVVITRFFTESIWLDIAFNFSVVLTFTFLAVNMFYEEQEGRRWQIALIGFCVLVFFVEGIMNLLSIF